MSTTTIKDLMAQVPEGETRTFVHSRTSDHPRRFFSVHSNYDGRSKGLDWHNCPPFIESPSTATYALPAVSVSTMRPPKLTCDSPASDMVDFYPWGGQVNFLSARLCALIEEHDPGSLDKARAVVRAKDAILEYYAVLPARSLCAIDVDATDIHITDEDMEGLWLRSIQFAGEIVFKEQPSSVLSFSDKYGTEWYWSRELIDIVRDAGITGIYTNVPGLGFAGGKVDSF